jgi:hypothetical protein
MATYGFFGDGIETVLKPKLITDFRAAGRRKMIFGELVGDDIRTVE